MTDNEIIKALECVSGKVLYCRNCPYSKKFPQPTKCKEACAKDALDLINRQKAEIERLKEDNEIKSQKRANIFEITNAYERGRAEAVKEFAERLKGKCDAPHWCVWLSEIEDLVKEFTEGESNGMA